jgi:hypothetical protein
MSQNNEHLNNIVSCMAEQSTFTILLAQTTEGEVVVRPIGKHWGGEIGDAVQEMAERYPGCKIRLFNGNSDWRKYFSGITAKEQTPARTAHPKRNHSLR